MQEKSYLLDSISQKDPKHLLKMTVHLAEFSAMMSKYNESMRYAYSGIAGTGVGRSRSQSQIIFLHR